MNQKPPDDKSESDSELNRKLREHQARQRANQPPQPPASPKPPPPVAPRLPSEQPTQPAIRTIVQPALAPVQQQQPAAQGRAGLYVPWWGFAMIGLVVTAATCGIWALVLTSGTDSATISNGLTPIFAIITNTPTAGAPEAVQLAPPQVVTATPEAVLQEEVVQTPVPQIVVGGEVTIVGTEGDGVAMRQGSGLQYSYFFVARDGEIFDVQDGPRESDGYVWWFIADPDIPDKAGWAVQDFMEGIPQGILQEVTPGPPPEAGSDG